MATQTSPSPSRPLIVMCAMPEVGHTYPLLQIATHLVSRSFAVFFVGGPQFERQIRATGAAYHECQNFVTPALGKRLHAIPDPKERHKFAIKHVFVDSIPLRCAALTRCLEDVRTRNPGREVVVINEIMFLGALPYLFGAPPPRGYERFPRVINFHTSILVMGSAEVPPFLSNLEYDPSPEGQERNRLIYEEREPENREIQAYANEVLRTLGATRELGGEFFQTAMMTGDVTLLPYSADLEYPRAELSEKFEFCGGLPLKQVDPDFEYPAWWSEVTSNAALPHDSADKKRVVFVTQGTVNNKPDQLIQPALRGLAGLQDTLVITTLGKRGAALSGDFDVPANARVIDYLPYNAILPYADAFLFNGGFGGYMHSIMNGVPMVTAGTSEDKAEVSSRAAWAGVALNLKTATPPENVVKEAVQTVLTESKFKERVVAIKRENEALDFMQHVDHWVWKLAE